MRERKDCTLDDQTHLTPPSRHKQKSIAVDLDCVFITINYPPEEIGSAPVVAPLAEHLAQRISALQVITAHPHYPENIWPEFSNGSHDSELINEVLVRRIATISGRDGLLGRVLNEGTFANALFWGRLTGKFPRGSNVLVLCPSILSVLVAIMFKTPGGKLTALVHDIQSGLGIVAGYNPNNPVIWITRKLEQLAFNRCDQLVVLSPQMRDKLRSSGVKTRIHIQPPQVDTELIHPLPLDESTPPTLLYSGNLGLKQGLVQLLNMAEALERRKTNYHLIIRGTGTQRRKLEDELKKRAQQFPGLTQNVQIEPLVERRKLNEGLAQGWIHLVPQLPEGANAALPSKLFAIMASGRPFIATAEENSPLARFSDTLRAGVCVSPMDAEAFADAVENLIADPELRNQMGREGRNYVLAYASHKTVLDKVCDYILPAPAAKHQPTKVEVRLEAAR